MRKMMRQIQNVWDGKYTIVGDADENDGKKRTAGGLRETDSRVARKLIEVGLAFPGRDADKTGAKR